MNEKDKVNQQNTGQGNDSGIGVPVNQSPSENESVTPSYRKSEEDSTMLSQEEKTGEGTGAKAGEYS